ncbi:hypothetical protein GCM10009019_01360 [Salarchaeum japonicum]|uniref:Uncharacterized protein n=1 Tax=Salarchaeum japonicum TaxID=555573 RepID=A0AAV3SWG8_9EURY
MENKVYGTPNGHETVGLLPPVQQAGPPITLAYEASEAHDYRTNGHSSFALSKVSPHNSAGIKRDLSGTR